MNRNRYIETLYGERDRSRRAAKSYFFIGLFFVAAVVLTFDLLID